MYMHYPTVELTSFLVTYVAVFLKGFQHKNVIKDKLLLIFITSFAMNAADVIVITTVALNGIAFIWWNGLGAAFGMISAILLHNHLYKHSS